MEEGEESRGASGAGQRERSFVCREADTNTETKMCMRMWRRDSEWVAGHGRRRGRVPANSVGVERPSPPHLLIFPGTRSLFVGGRLHGAEVNDQGMLEGRSDLGPHVAIRPGGARKRQPPMIFRSI
jgi:hypothetical protein